MIDAVNDYSKFATLTNNSAGALLSRGIAFYKLGRYDVALSDLTPAREKLPGVSENYLYLGLTEKALGRLNEARATLKEGADICSKYQERKGRSIKVNEVWLKIKDEQKRL